MTHHERFHSLDAVRAFALLAGVVLHAAMSFLPGFGATGWPISDNSPSVVLGVTFYVIHIFRMTLFFVIAGFFGRMLLHRLGVRAFIGNRAKRILAPLVVGWMIVMPLIVVALIWSASKATAVKPAMAPPPTEPLPFPLTHLWFLYVLLWLYAATLVIRAVVARLPNRGETLKLFADRFVRIVMQTALAPLILAVPSFAALITKSGWMAWFGIPTPDQSLIPNLPAFVAFSTAFGLGWLLQRQPDLLRAWERRAMLNLALAVSLTVACLALIGVRPLLTTATGDWKTWLYAACYATAIWAWTLALIGCALRFFAGHSPARRYVADASYWIYLLHLPVVFLLQVAVQDQPWHWSVKFALILTVALAFLFASYHYLVRSTFIGEVLNGRRYSRHAIATPVVTTIEIPHDAQPLAELRNVRQRYGKTVALDGLDLEIRRGELLALLGPNGAGKTSAISLLLGLRQCESGEALLFGRSPQDIEARRNIGVMMQEVNLPAELRVRELIDLVAAHYPAPYGIDEVLELTQTTALADRIYNKLSGGQKRQVQFAIALCGRPQLLFLDEPTVGLDIEARTMLWRTLRKQIADGASIVLTTHYLEEAESLADRVVVLAKGHVIASGSVDEIRSAVMRKRISCRTAMTANEIAAWPGVISASEENGQVHILASDADATVRRLITTDATTRDLEVVRAGLAEAFSELTKDAA